MKKKELLILRVCLRNSWHTMLALKPIKTRWEQELQPYNQSKEERISNLDNLLMQFKELIEYTQQAFKSLEIQVEVEAHEESLVEERDSREKDKEKSEEKAQQWEKCSQVEIQQESILQVNTPPHQLIVKEERHGEHEKALSVILSLITSTSLAMIWMVFPEYMSFMESLAKKQKCKEDVFYVTFMPP
ncbi:hypothetical protein JHK82_012516 [Glycine max]|nr:hypothetical protein JHK85_012871 [Glycine max]KAG5154547.1 hypothetical protein JHK82_012516 [Glycine max]